MSIGENIRRLREKKDMSQEALAEAVRVSGPMICQIERNTRVPTLPLGQEIARVLGCTVNDLLK